MSHRLTLKATGVSVLLGLVVLVFTTLHPVSGREVPSKNEVVMMRCEPGPYGFHVTAYSQSLSAPSRRSDNCPEALSLLKGDGFRVLNIACFDKEGGHLVYTLVR